MATGDGLPVTLLDLLSNSLLLRQTAPCLPIDALLRLSATSKAFRELIMRSSDSWRHLDLTTVRHASIDSTPIDVGGVSWRAERMDEALTEDDFYAGPLRGIFSKLHRDSLLANIQTLILDRLSVPADLVREIVAEDRYRVRILSIREAKNLNINKLNQVLRYIVRPTRPEGSPTLKGLYVFGSASDHHPLVPEMPLQGRGIIDAQGAQIGAEHIPQRMTQLLTGPSADQIKWYHCSGKVFSRPTSQWPETLQVCKGIINFNAVLCRGPRHDITKVDSKDFLQPTIASVALGPRGCEECKSCPEGAATFGDSEASTLPLLAPVPSHSSAIKAAQEPKQTADGKYPGLILRCEDCLRDRWCEQCNRWWCEDCYAIPKSGPHHRTNLQQIEMRDELRHAGWSAPNELHKTSIKVLSKLCVEDCFVQEMMRGAGSNGMWG